jgi:voltage-gated potassium channel
MEFTFLFLSYYFVALKLGYPLLLFLMTVIVILGLVVARRESWSHGDAIYWAFVTGTTVGYGDIRPTRGLSRLLAIVIAIIGVVFTGLMVSLALWAAQQAIAEVHDVAVIDAMIRQKPN